MKLRIQEIEKKTGELVKPVYQPGTEPPNCANLNFPFLSGRLSGQAKLLMLDIPHNIAKNSEK